MELKRFGVEVSNKNTNCFSRPSSSQFLFTVLMFGSSSDSDSDTDTTEDNIAISISNVLLTKCKRNSHVLCYQISKTDQRRAILTQRLQSHFNLSFETSLNAVQIEYDAVILLSPETLKSFLSEENHQNLIPGGYLFFPTNNPDDHGQKQQDDSQIQSNQLNQSQQSKQPNQSKQSEPLEELQVPRIPSLHFHCPSNNLPSNNISYLRRDSIRINTTAGSPSTGKSNPSTSNDTNPTTSTSTISSERLQIEAAVVHRSASERLASSTADQPVLSIKSHAAAVQSLRKYGICIIPSFFSKQLIINGGKCAVDDVQHAIERLEKAPINMQLTPSPPKDVNYEGYATKDEQFVRGHDDKYTLKRGLQLNEYASKHANSIRHNPSLIKVLEELVLPSNASEERKAQTMLRRSSSLLESHDLGAVVAIPGNNKNSDQSIHVDTEHLYEHLHLPPHYVVMFLPSLSTTQELSHSVGQTAFCLGSHMGDQAREITKNGKMEGKKTRKINVQDERNQQLKCTLLIFILV